MEEKQELAEQNVAPAAEPGARSKRAHKKQQQILTGAQRAFLEYGYARASTDLIAQSAGVSKQTLYVHYENKPQLLAAVLRNLLDEVTFPSIAPHLELRDALRELAQQIIRRIMQPEYIALLRIIIAEAPHHPEIAEMFVTTVPARGFATVTEILHRAKIRGETTDIDVEAVARLFIGSLLTYAIIDGLLAIGAPPRPPEEARLEAIVSLTVRACN